MILRIQGQISRNGAQAEDGHPVYWTFSPDIFVSVRISGILPPGQDGSKEGACPSGGSTG